jgi:hypothetical protein
VPDVDAVFERDGRIKRPDLMKNHGQAVLAILDYPKPNGAFGNPDAVQWLEAHGRFLLDFKFGEPARRQRAEAITFMHRMLADGLLASGYLEPGTGKLHWLKKEAWNCQPSIATERFRTCQIDMAYPFGRPEDAPKLSMKCWLFIAKRSVEDFVKGWTRHGQLQASPSYNSVEIEDTSEDASAKLTDSGENITKGGGRGKPTWYPRMVELVAAYYRRCDNAQRSGKPQPRRPSNNEILKALLRDSPTCGAKIGAVTYNRAHADRDAGTQEQSRMIDS